MTAARWESHELVTAIRQTLATLGVSGLADGYYGE
jgi:hypothetical protein